MFDVKKQYIKELYFDQPIVYKNLSIYPVTMKDYLDFHWLVSCLLIDKNSIPDVNIISMSYLKFLYYQSSSQDKPYVYMLKALLCMVLHLDLNYEIRFYINNDKAFFNIDNVEYNSADFDNIVDIIFEQNCISHIDESIQKELRDEFERAQRYRQQQNNQKICSLEEQMICVMISTPLDMESIYKLTIRKFEKILQRVDAKMHYQIYLSASMSGMVEFKDKNAIKYWMSDLSKDDNYSDVKVDIDDMKNKIDNINQ